MSHTERQPPGLDRLYTTTELAARWGCTPETISRKYRLLGLKPLRIGKRNNFTEGDILLAEKRQRGERI